MATWDPAIHTRHEAEKERARPRLFVVVAQCAVPRENRSEYQPAQPLPPPRRTHLNTQTLPYWRTGAV